MSLRVWIDRLPTAATGVILERLQKDGVVRLVSSTDACDVAIVARADVAPPSPPALGRLVYPDVEEPNAGSYWTLADASSRPLSFGVHFHSAIGLPAAFVGGRTVVPPDPGAARKILAGRLAVSAGRLLRRVASAGAGALVDALPSSPILPVSDSVAAIAPSEIPPARRRLSGLLTRLGRRVGRISGEDQWQLRVTSSANTFQLMTSAAEALIPPRGTIWADPFLLEHEGETWLLAEELDDPRGKGVIVAFRRTTDAQWSGPHPVMRQPWHLSYPQPLWHDGQLYLVPEMSESRSVKAYRCERMPDQWIEVATLVQDDALLDATLVQHDGRWWMFATKNGELGESPYEDLYVYYADSPLASEWTPHPWNPVLTDVSAARGAGPIFTDADGRLLRPAQDCSWRYGGGITLTEITTLTTTRFEARLIEQLVPNGSHRIRGAHHFSRSANFQVIDVEVALR